MKFSDRKALIALTVTLAIAGAVSKHRYDVRDKGCGLFLEMRWNHGGGQTLYQSATKAADGSIRWIPESEIDDAERLARNTRTANCRKQLLSEYIFGWTIAGLACAGLAGVVLRRRRKVVRAGTELLA